MENTIDNNFNIDEVFDDFLHQINKGITIEKYNKGIKYMEFDKFKPWKSKYGYIFNIFGNDHLIDGQKHFHFKNSEKNVDCKISFNGKILESKGKNQLDKNIFKILKKFLLEENNLEKLNKMWDEKNPIK